MAELLDRAARTVTASRSPVGFATTGGEHWKVWDRFLTIDGVHAYHIGNICGTCAFFFERMEGADAAVDVGALTASLYDGLVTLDAGIVESLTQLMPSAEYIIALLRVRPELVRPNGSEDYFAVEQIEQVGPNYWGDEPPHDTKTDYYRLEGRSAVALPHTGADTAGFDFIIPMTPRTALSEERVQFYEAAIAGGQSPTAVAVSVLDIKGPYDGADHWCLAHYLLDGHHKIAAAARTGSEITLVAFIAVDQGISDRESIEAMLSTYPRTAG
ncbi:MAG: hypothetical protein B7Y97_01625 [Sphingomonas sp. 32-66-10]|nr:MAG: hypothetical protein B7Y97_01625 [Sphingomonas sp. 32-66-10]